MLLVIAKSFGLHLHVTFRSRDLEWSSCGKRAADVSGPRVGFVDLRSLSWRPTGRRPQVSFVEALCNKTELPSEEPLKTTKSYEPPSTAPRSPANLGFTEPRPQVTMQSYCSWQKSSMTYNVCWTIKKIPRVLVWKTRQDVRSPILICSFLLYMCLAMEKNACKGTKKGKVNEPVHFMPLQSFSSLTYCLHACCPDTPHRWRAKPA